jgi:hypothetical protein
MPDPIGTIPQSPALAEANGDSLAELFSRDPEGYTSQDLAKVVAALREQRVRWAAAEAAGATKAPTATKAKTLVSVAKAADLGL